MNLRKMLFTVSLMLAFAFMLPVLHADDWNQATRFTFSQPVQVPGHILPAGTYLFQLVGNNHHLVQIFREDHTAVAILYSIPRSRYGGREEAAITLANRGGTQPQAIVAWFFVGETEGHEFLYPTQEEQELAHAAQKTFVSGD
jgi:Protein of unknown function (DUF2911)